MDCCAELMGFLDLTRAGEWLLFGFLGAMAEKDLGGVFVLLACQSGKTKTHIGQGCGGPGQALDFLKLEDPKHFILQSSLIDLLIFDELSNGALTGVDKVPGKDLQIPNQIGINLADLFDADEDIGDLAAQGGELLAELLQLLQVGGFGGLCCCQGYGLLGEGRKQVDEGFIFY